MLLMNDPSAGRANSSTPRPGDTLSADFTRKTATASHSMSQVRPASHCMGQTEPPLAHELRQAVAELQEKNAAMERQIKELRGAVVALMEPDMPRVLRTPGGIIVLDKK